MRLVHLARTILRGIIFFVLLVPALVSYAAVFAVPRERRRAARVNWLGRWCAIHARALGIRILVQGEPPRAGLLIANHLSYLDIIVLSAAARPAFVSKAEVARWPIFGPFARMAGTIFVDRSRRTEVRVIADQMRAALAEVPLTLFPEGTSSSGAGLLPFKTALFEPVAELHVPVTAVALSYELDDGHASEEVCYWGGMTLLPHLLNLWGKREVRAYIRFGPARPREGDRKAIAQELFEEIAALRATLPIPAQRPGSPGAAPANPPAPSPSPR